MSIVRSPVRSVVRSPVQGVFGGASLLEQATSALGNVAPYHWLDFIANRALYASVDVGNVTGATGYSFTRASQGYYTNADGTLTLFGSGALRRGDRGVLIEGARTNLCLRSQEFNSGWTLQNTTIGTDATAAPDGTTTADKLTEDSATGGHNCFRSVTIAGSVAQAFSVFAKAAERSIIWIAAYDGDGATARVAWFNLATGAVGTVQAGATATIQALANGWYRCTIVRTNSSALTAGIIQIGVTTTDNVSSYAGTTGSGAFIWGAQVETASFPSSYIPTVAASATRAADSLVYTLPGVASGYSMWAQYADSQNSSGRVIDFGNSTLIRRSIGFLSFNGAGLEGAVAGTFASGKAAIAIDAAAVRAALNGSSVTVTTGSYSSSSQTAWNLGSTGSSNYLDSYISRVAYFNSALSAAQLTASTT